MQEQDKLAPPLQEIIEVSIANPTAVGGLHFPGRADPGQDRRIDGVDDGLNCRYCAHTLCIGHSADFLKDLIPDLDFYF